jgi:RNA polymerase sigma-70 factor (ECF subfamily)
MKLDVCRIEKSSLFSKKIQLYLEVVVEDVLAEAGSMLEAHRSAVRLHCYRMTGSLHDADDLTQETFLKAWEKIRGFRGESSMVTWLYRIATNVCLDFLRGKKNRTLPFGPDFHRYDSGASLPADFPEAVWLEPYPDPESQTLRKEELSLAFLVVLQTLSPRQRAVLILTDLLGYSGKETAQLLGLSVAAVNSALQRSRAALGPNRAAAVINPAERREVLERFLRAWERGDAAGIVALMKEDSMMVMPPIPLWVQGRADIERVLLDYPFRRGDPKHWKLVDVPGANGEPAAAFYQLDAEAGLYRTWGIQVIVLEPRRSGALPMIAEYYVFKGAHLVEAFGQPAILSAP